MCLTLGPNAVFTALLLDNANISVVTLSKLLVTKE